MTVRSEHRLKGMFAYVPGWNPRRQQPPTPRRTSWSRRGTKAVAILDAKYRDLWENPLPRDMLYQLAIYAMSHEGGTPRSSTRRSMPRRRRPGSRCGTRWVAGGVPSSP